LDYWISERSIGEFQRSFSFPTSVDVDRVNAGLENGILKVTVPKMEQKGGKRLQFLELGSNEFFRRSLLDSL
jgi:HSP20 family protein